MLEVTHDDVLDIPDVPGVGPFQAGVFRRDVLQHGDSGLPADAPSPLQVRGIKVPFQVQVVRQGALDEGGSVPTSEPLFHLIVLDPFPDDLAIPVGQAVEEGSLPVDETQLTVQYPGGEVVIVQDIPQLDGKPVVVAERDDPFTSDIHGKHLPVRITHPPEGRRNPVPQFI